LILSGEFKILIDKEMKFSEIAQAMDYVGNDQA
jgi:hypothetical protein